MPAGRSVRSARTMRLLLLTVPLPRRHRGRRRRRHGALFSAASRCGSQPRGTVQGPADAAVEQDVDPQVVGDGRDARRRVPIAAAAAAAARGVPGFLEGDVDVGEGQQAGQVDVWVCRVRGQGERQARADEGGEVGVQVSVYWR